MPNKTQFSNDWLKKKDSNGDILETWCEKTGSKYEAYCKYCKKIVKCSNRGFSQLLHHSESKFHISVTKDLSSGLQTQIQKTVVQSSSNNISSLSNQNSSVHDSASSSLSLWSQRDSVMKAELIWSIKTAGSNYTYASSDFVGDTFRAMFPDSQIASKFHMNRTKMSYLVSEATGPYFHSALLYDVKKSASVYSLLYDELTNKQVKKQLDIKIRYWSEAENQVNVNHLATHLMGQAKAKDIADCLTQTLNENNLMLKDLITVGSDGPNVNKAVFELLCETKKSISLPPLIQVGTCCLHVVHNAFGKGVKECGQQAVDLIIDLNNFFKLSPVRREEFNEIQIDLQLDEQKFLKHVESRWLTLVPAAERVITQWSAIKKYLLTELPKRDQKISQNERYKRIMRCIKGSPLTTQSQLYFLIHASIPFQKFLRMFQKEEPLIHVLHEEMCVLIKSLLSRFVKINEIAPKAIEELTELKLSNLHMQVDKAELEVGPKTRKVLEKLSSGKQDFILNGMRRFYCMATEHLFSKLPLSNTVLKNCSCLSYHNITEPWSSTAITSLSQSLSLVPALNEDLISDEWKILQCEHIPKKWFFTEKEPITDEESLSEGETATSKEKSSLTKETKMEAERIDHFWAKIFSLKSSLGEEKFPELKRLIKAVLVLPHGNADVERGFSQTSNYLVPKRSVLSATSVSSLQSTKDGLRKYKRHFDKVQISKDFLQTGHNAHRSYMHRLEKQRQLKEERRKKKQEEAERSRQKQEEREKRQKDFETKSIQAKKSILMEKDLKRKEQQANEDLQNYTAMMGEANERTRKALKNNDLKGAKVGQTMLEAAMNKLEESRSYLENIRSEQKEIEMNKRTLLDYFCKSSEKNKKLKK